MKRILAKVALLVTGMGLGLFVMALFVPMPIELPVFTIVSGACLGIVSEV